VWVVITAIASARTLKSVIQGLINPINSISLTIDALVLMVFLILFFLLLFEKIQHLPIAGAILLMVLLVLSYVRLGGVAGTTEYNLMALGVLFVLAYRDRQLIFLMALYFLFIIGANLDLRHDGWLTQHVFQRTSTSLDNYFTTLITMVVLMLYFKHALVKESERVMNLRNKLRRQITTVKRQNEELEEQQKLLRFMNNRLKEEIKNQDDQINNQNKAIADYLWLSTESLQLSLQRILANARDLHGDDLLETKLNDQIAELDTVVNNLLNDLKRHDEGAQQ
jgi:hypothetical protein